MAVRWPSGVPVTDLSLVLGDTVPVRIRVDHALTDCTPALAVKQTIGSPDLIMTVTGWTREDDWHTASWVVNTAPLQAALGSADSVALVAEVVLVSPAGAQHTSRPIRVTVRRDILPAEYAPPAEVLADWHELINAALAAQLPDALHDAGMYVTPVSGTASMSPPSYDANEAVSWSWARFKFGDDLLSGYVGNVCKVRDVYMWGLPGVTDTTPRWLDIWRRAPGGDWVLASRSTNAVGASTSVDLYGWGMDATVEIVIGDEVALHVYGGTPEAPMELPLAVARQRVATANGRGLADTLDGPITDDSVMPAVMLSCTYYDGASVGGVPLATRAEIDRTKDYVDHVSADVYASARQVRQDTQEAQAAATSANTSATNAATSATAAQQALAAMPQVDAGGNMAIAGGLAVAGTITATGGVRVPAPATAQYALSYEALIEQRAADDWRRMAYYMDTLIPSWVTTIMRQIQMASAYNVSTANASITEGVYSNDWQDMLVTITPAAGISLIGRSTGAWKFANYLGDHNNSDYAAATVWRIIGSDKVSHMHGSTSQGYSSETNPSAACYAHPIHWCDHNLAGADYRYPLLNAVNNYTGRDMAPAWQVTVYPKDYLGSSTSCLLRGTDYGRDVGDQQYMWALVPGVTYLSVAMTPRQSADHRNVMNRWSLFVDSKYVMSMTSLFCGSGHTASVAVKAKAHEVSSTLQVGMRMGGMRIDATPALGVTNVWSIMERVVMQGATVKPVSTVDASSLEIPAAGGEVTLTVSSTLAEDIYVINDTMCGHDPAAVWCSQSTEQIPAGGGEVTLTLAPNTTGQPRQVWAFVGHHYAQAAVIKINQLA